MTYIYIFFLKQLRETKSKRGENNSRGNLCVQFPSSHLFNEVYRSMK